VEKIKTVILCGGKGIRLRPYTEDMPKPMMMIGDKPVLWHIMKIYSHFGFKDFVLSLGYKGDKIVEWCKKNCEKGWNIEFVDTGDVGTTQRLLLVRKNLDEDNFFCTYGDGVSDISIQTLLDFHKKHGKIATVTLAHPQTHFGFVEVRNDGKIIKFVEKPIMKEWVNGGFFVFKKEIFDYLERRGKDDMIEREPFEKLARDGQMMGYMHRGFWKCMDTYADLTLLNDLWEKDPKWMLWKK
jgi:glucose-1-phosphate cytidylyltransferase